MNKYLKIVSILLIMMYCFSPLAAIDINGTDGNNKLETNTTESIDNDSYANNVTKVSNVTEDLKTIDVQDELKDPNLSIHVDDIYEDETGTIEVYADKSFNERLYVEISNNLIPVKISNGYGVCKIGKFAKGHYDAKISFQGNDEFKPSQCSAEFNVLERTIIDPNLRISIKDVYENEPAVIEFYADKDFKGIIIGAVGDKTFTVMVENGYGKVVINDGFEVGNYTVKAKFFCDGKYNDWEGSTNFNVFEKKDLNMKVDVCEIFREDVIDGRPHMLVGDRVEVTVDTDKNFTGTVHVDVCNQSQDINVIDGHGVAWIYVGKLIGNFTCTTTFPGSHIYKESKVLTNFEMKQYF